jgi:hypothetical protein
MQALNARLSSAERPRITRSCCGTGGRWCSGGLLALGDVARAGRVRRPADDDRPASAVVPWARDPAVQEADPGARVAQHGLDTVSPLDLAAGHRLVVRPPLRGRKRRPGDRQCSWVHFSGRALRRLPGGAVRVLTGRGGGRYDLKLARAAGQPPTGAARFGEWPRPAAVRALAGLTNAANCTWRGACQRGPTMH